MIKQLSRRRFLQNSMALALFGLVDFKKYTPLLSFSTLGCPDWTFDQILNFAVANHYDGIEFRGLLREMDLTKCKEFNKENIKTTLQRFKDMNLKIVDLGSSSVMHLPEGQERNKSLEEAKNFITVAHQLNCPYIRVFPNVLPKDKYKSETFHLIAQSLNELGAFANNTGVMVLMETHGDLVHVADIEEVMSMVNQPNVGLVWDIVNMWSVTKEPVEEVYPKLKKHIHHTHIKDLKFSATGQRYVLLGKGDAPIFKAVKLLAKDRYNGFYSYEWEKLWHPEIDAPEIALADYPVAMKKFFKTI
jgi:sugar phosphate isomerase/epimerase